MTAGLGDAASRSTDALADALLTAFSLTGETGFNHVFTLQMPHLHVMEAGEDTAVLFGVSALPVSGEAIFYLTDLARIRLVVEPLLRRGEAWSGRLRVRPQAATAMGMPEDIELRVTAWASSAHADGSTDQIKVVARRADGWADLTAPSVMTPDPDALRAGIEASESAATDAELRFTPVIDLTNGETVQILGSSHDPASGSPLGSGQRSIAVALDDSADLAKSLFARRRGDAAHLSLPVHPRELRSALDHTEATHAADLALPMNALGFELGSRLVRALHGIHLARLHSLTLAGLPATVTVEGFSEADPPVTAGLLAAAGAGVVRLVAAPLHRASTVQRALTVASEAGCALIASGIAAPDDIGRLSEAGCRYATGPLFGRALSRGRLERFLDEPVLALTRDR